MDKAKKIELYFDDGFLTSEFLFFGLKLRKKVKPGRTRFYINGLKLISCKNNYTTKDLIPYGYDFIFAHYATDIKYYVDNTKKQKKEMLLVCTDSIGDYLLWRNFIDDIRNSDKYAQFSISMIACETYRHFLEYLDADKLHKVFYVPGRFENLSTRKLIDIRRRLKDEGLKDYYDTIVFCSVNAARDDKFKAEQLITGNVVSRFSILHNHSLFKRNPLDLLKFTYVYRNYEDTFLHDFSKAKNFFSAFLGKESSIEYPRIELKTTEKNEHSGKYVVINPCGYDEYRCWNRVNWAELITWLHAQGLEVFLVCLEKERRFCEVIQTLCDGIAKIAAGLAVPDLLTLMSKAQLYIGADSGIFHAAAALDMKCMALSSGSSYFRFMNYPKERKNVRVLFPEGVEKWIQKHRENDAEPDLKNFSINSIRMEEVQAACRDLLAVE